jgi:hypothetical protein
MIIPFNEIHTIAHEREDALRQTAQLAHRISPQHDLRWQVARQLRALAQWLAPEHSQERKGATA